MTGHGLQLRLDRAHRGAIELILSAGSDLAPGRHVGPGGLVIEVAGPRTLDVPPPAPTFVHARFAETPFHEGRAGLLYRDLLPSRLGGRSGRQPYPGRPRWSGQGIGCTITRSDSS